MVSSELAHNGIIYHAMIRWLIVAQLKLTDGVHRFSSDNQAWGWIFAFFTTWVRYVSGRYPNEKFDASLYMDGVW